MKYIYDPADTRLLTSLEKEVIQDEINRLEKEYGINVWEDILFHDMSVDSPYDFIMSGHDEYVFVTRTSAEDEVIEHPNAQ